MKYDFARHCYLLADDQFNEGCRNNFYNPAYAERCFERARNFYAIAELLGYTYEIHLNIQNYLAGY